MPREVADLILGDPEISASQMETFMPRHMIQTILVNKDHRNSIGVVGGYFWIDFLKEIIQVGNLPKRSEIILDSRNIFFGENVDNLN